MQNVPTETYFNHYMTLLKVRPLELRKLVNPETSLITFFFTVTEREKLTLLDKNIKWNEGILVKESPFPKYNKHLTSGATKDPSTTNAIIAAQNSLTSEIKNTTTSLENTITAQKDQSKVNKPINNSIPKNSLASEINNTIISLENPVLVQTNQSKVNKPIVNLTAKNNPTSEIKETTTATNEKTEEANNELETTPDIIEIEQSESTSDNSLSEDFSDEKNTLQINLINVPSEMSCREVK